MYCKTLTNNSNDSQFTEKCKDHIICSCGYNLICVDKIYKNNWKNYIGKDAIDKLSNNLLNDCEYCRGVIEK